MRRLFLHWFVVFALAALASAQTRMVVIGLDGCSPDGVRKANAPNLAKMRAQGAWTLRARGVMPTVSSPNWASMIMGAGPEQHGITSNDWQPDKFDFPAVFVGSRGRFPTIFGLMRDQRSKATIAVIHDWTGFGRLVEPGVADVIENPKGAEATVARAIEVWKQRRPELLFVHIDHADHVGHEKGHGTREYYASIGEVDGWVGRIANATAGAYVLVTADHGGVGKKHGGNTLKELEIPWILTGPGVARGHEIQASVNTTDTAATVAHIFQLKAPQAWIGRPVLEAFR
ncbi:MAG: alkaline phosphatase [Bryobacteraceae bacterium]|nr:alkaline phosphatase [Bryobacteraceae bacterium]